MALNDYKSPEKPNNHNSLSKSMEPTMKWLLATYGNAEIDEENPQPTPGAFLTPSRLPRRNFYYVYQL